MNRQLMQECLDVLRRSDDPEEKDRLIQALKTELGKIEDDPISLINNYYSFHSKQMAAYLNIVKNADETINQLAVELIRAKKR
jgi:hypothetical protein